MEHFVGLSLADGCKWLIIPSDDRSYDFVLTFANTMKLKFQENSAKNASKFQTVRRLIVKVDKYKSESALAVNLTQLKFENNETTIFAMFSEASDKTIWIQLMSLSIIICHGTQINGGVLLHGALAEWKGKGVILAGPGGRGKTTASRRFPHYWESLCDDTTLVVCDDMGTYWAHPWPTWSTFTTSDHRGKWDVQHATPLKGVFFLDQSHKDRCEAIGKAQNVCLLNASAEQVSRITSFPLKINALRKHRLQRFNNICNLAHAVPSYILHTCQNGSFWQEIEKVISA
jgi:SynChlorMet cassette protein ScmC